jgi:putative aldouronate transport system permease protein
MILAHVKRMRKFTPFTVVTGFVVLFVILVTLYPFVNILAVSLSGNVHVMKNEVSFYPKGLTFLAYKYVFQNKKFFRAYYNTVVLVVLGTLASLFVTTLGAYSLAQQKMLFRKFFTIMVIIPMFFQGGMIPLFLAVKSYGLLDSVWAIILPFTVSVWNLLIMRAFFIGFSQELIDSGRMDGLNDIGIFWYIVLPLSKAVLATIALFYAVAYWNTYFAPLIYLKSTYKYPLQLQLRAILMTGESFQQAAELHTADAAVVETSLKYACIIVSVVPILLVYPFAQKHFVKGIMLGSVKG